MADQQRLNDQTTPLGVQPTTGQISVDQQRNQMLAQISAFLGILSGGGGATNGSVFAYTLVSGDTVLTGANTGVAVDAAGGPRTITLPLASSIPGKMFFVKKIDSSANMVTITRQGSDTIDGASSIILTFPGQAVFIQSYATTLWYIF